MIRLTREVRDAAYAADTDTPSLDLAVTWPDGATQPVRVHLTITRQSRGTRFWFACPRCSRRCGVLHSPSPSVAFACRKCHGLRYTSQTRRSVLRRFLDLTDRHWELLSRLAEEVDEANENASRRKAWSDAIRVLEQAEVDFKNAEIEANEFDRPDHEGDSPTP